MAPQAAVDKGWLSSHGCQVHAPHAALPLQGRPHALHLGLHLFDRSDTLVLAGACQAYLDHCPCSKGPMLCIWACGISCTRHQSHACYIRNEMHADESADKCQLRLAEHIKAAASAGMRHTLHLGLPSQV